MYFDTRAEPAGFNRQLRERVAQVHLRVHRRQRVLARRRQHLEERAVPIVVAIGDRRTPTSIRPQPRLTRAASSDARLQPRSWRRDAMRPYQSPACAARPADDDRTRRLESATRARTNRRAVAMVTSTGRSSETACCRRLRLSRGDRDTGSQIAAHSALLLFASTTPSPTCTFGIDRFVDSSKPPCVGTKAAAVTCQCGAIEIETRAVKAALIERPLEVADQPRMQPLVLQLLRARRWAT